MARKHRKLFPTLTSTNQTDCPDFCDQTCPDGCNPYADVYFLPPPSPPGQSPPPPPLSTNQSGQPISLYVIIVVSLLASFFLLLSYFVIIVKFCSGRSPFRQPPAQPDDQGEEFLDENRGPAIDHPIWYINTVGLQPSVINSITVFKYKKGDPLIEGSDCSVCLSEFREDETLRLLPKCNHAFHIPCIDTWLRSHTNCPICRAGIVSSNGTAPSTSIDQSPPPDSTPEEEIQMDNTDTSVESCNNLVIHSDDLENRPAVESPDGDDERKEFDDSENGGGFSVVDCLEEKDRILKEEIQPKRRSVSMYSASDAIINLPESDPNSINCREDHASSNINRVSGSDSISESLHMSPTSLSRSISNSGRFFLPRHCRNLSSVLPL